METSTKMQSNNSTQAKPERRKFKRDKFHYKIELLTSDGKKNIRCASFDLSEGGIRVVTNVELKDPGYIVVIDRHKLLVKRIHEEVRFSSMMNQNAFYHGLQFVKPLSSEERHKLIDSSKKSGF